MTDQPAPNAPGADALQFENAEYVTPAPTGMSCAVCRNTIPDSYYEVNGKVVCDRCRAAIEAHRAGGSGFVRFLLASFYGLGGAIAGFAVYYAVLRFAHMEVGLISILVGFLVGAGVRKGSQGRGGWLYQALAIFLTYTAIACCYAAVLYPDVLAKIEAQQAAPDAPGPKAAPPPSFVKYAVVAVIAIVLGYAAPFLQGLGNIIGLAIIAFALYEAWKLNRRADLVFNGPFQVRSDLPLEGVPNHA